MPVLNIPVHNEEVYDSVAMEGEWRSRVACVWERHMRRKTV